MILFLILVIEYLFTDFIYTLNHFILVQNKRTLYFPQEYLPGSMGLKVLYYVIWHGYVYDNSQTHNKALVSEGLG